MNGLMADCRELLREQVEYRELLWQMTKRDLLLRYKQTVMGFGWAVFMPLINTAVFTVIFTKAAPIPTPVAYVVFAYCGLWVWNFHASALRFSMVSLTSNINLVSKVYFPREIFPFSALFVCLVDFAVGGLVMVAMMIWYQIPVGLSLLWFPVVLLVQLIFTGTIGLIVSMANLFYRDVKYLFEIVITVWMFATSVLYPAGTLGSGTLGTIVRLNPMTPIVDAYRNVLLLNQPPSAAFALTSVASVVLLGIAWIVFHRSEFQFAENI
jgi:ABC-type polysaccharide/polyol phosphate export permease